MTSPHPPESGVDFIRALPTLLTQHIVADEVARDDAPALFTWMLLKAYHNVIGFDYFDALTRRKHVAPPNVIEFPYQLRCWRLIFVRAKVCRWKWLLRHFVRRMVCFLPQRCYFVFPAAARRLERPRREAHTRQWRRHVAKIASFAKKETGPRSDIKQQQTRPSSLQATNPTVRFHSISALHHCPPSPPP